LSQLVFDIRFGQVVGSVVGERLCIWFLNIAFV